MTSFLIKHSKTTVFKRFILILLPLFSSSALVAQQVIPIWGEEVPPFSRLHTVEEYEAPCWGEVICAHQVVEPTLTLFLPANEGRDTLVVILPGGGYEVEAIYHEGYEIAGELARRGVAAAVLKYRLPNPETTTRPELVPATDVRQALKLIRANQPGLGVKASKIGVMGFSAGSHLATWTSVHRSDDPEQNPDFSILVYGVTRLTPVNQDWLEKTLYHRKMTEDEIAKQNLLERVDGDTPPAFLVHAYDDNVCHFSESTLYAQALTDNGVDAELHLYAHGGHGFGPGREDDGTNQWIALAVNWLDRLSRTPGQPETY